MVEAARANAPTRLSGDDLTFWWADFEELSNARVGP
jgi:hypothetical protein